MPNGFPIDLASVNWLYVAILAAFVFLASLIGNFLSFGRRVSGAILTAILFVATFVAWSYYPHGLPLPTRLAGTSAAAPASPRVPVAPLKPANPVTDVTPPAAPQRPANPIRDITPPRQ